MKTRSLLIACFIFAAINLTLAQTEPWLKYRKAASDALRERRYDDAQHNLQIVLKELDKADIKDIRLAETLGNLAFTYERQRKDSRAEELYLRALGVYENNGAPSDRIALTLWNLAKVYVSAGKLDQAEPAFAKALMLAEKEKGPENLLLAGIIGSLADLQTKLRRYAEAEAGYKRALPIYEKSLGAEHWTVGAMLEDYAALLKKMNRKSEASQLEARVKEIRAKKHESQPYVIP